MNVLQVTSREFRDNQKSFFDLVDAGQEIVIRRKNKVYLLSSIEEDEFRLSPEALKRIEQSRQQYKDGNFVSYENADDAVKFLESL